jgi:hypothetical protein
MKNSNQLNREITTNEIFKHAIELREQINQKTNSEVPILPRNQEDPSKNIFDEYDDYEDYFADIMEKRTAEAPTMEENRKLWNAAYDRHYTKTIQIVEGDQTLSQRERKILLLMLTSSLGDGYGVEVENIEALLQPNEMNFFKIRMRTTENVDGSSRVIAVPGYHVTILWKYVRYGSEHYIFAESKTWLQKLFSRKVRDYHGWQPKKLNQFQKWRKGFEDKQLHRILNKMPNESYSEQATTSWTDEEIGEDMYPDIDY